MLRAVWIFLTIFLIKHIVKSETLATLNNVADVSSTTVSNTALSVDDSLIPTLSVQAAQLNQPTSTEYSSWLVNSCRTIRVLFLYDLR